MTSPALPFDRPARGRLPAALPALVALAIAAAAPASRAGDDSGGFSAGIDIRPSASAGEVGLAIYPGATRRKDKDDDSPALSLSLWGGALGMKLVVLKFASGDPPERVAAYYRDALGRDGPVLDCSPPRPPKAPGAAAARDKKALHCDDDGDDAPAGTRVYKSGSAKHHRIVHVSPAGSGATFDLVRLDLAAD